MAGKIIADIIEAPAGRISLNVANVTVASINASGVFSSTGNLLITQAGSVGIAAIEPSSIVGTVSQSGGVPTGAIIERGNNANGSFVKYADGTMFCWGTTTRTLNIPNSYLGGFRSGGEEFDFTFPATFSAAPILVANPAFDASFSIITRDQTTATTGSVLLTAVTSQGSQSRTIRWFATGRWF